MAHGAHLVNEILSTTHGTSILSDLPLKPSDHSQFLYEIMNFSTFLLKVRVTFEFSTIYEVQCTM